MFSWQDGENYCCDEGSTCCGHLGSLCCPLENVGNAKCQCLGNANIKKGVCCEDTSCCPEDFSCLPDPGGCGLAKQNNTDNVVSPCQFSITSAEPWSVVRFIGFHPSGSRVAAKNPSRQIFPCSYSGCCWGLWHRPHSLHIPGFKTSENAGPALLRLVSITVWKFS